MKKKILLLLKQLLSLLKIRPLSQKESYERLAQTRGAPKPRQEGDSMLRFSPETSRRLINHLRDDPGRKEMPNKRVYKGRGIEIKSHTGRPVGPSNTITTVLRLLQWRQRSLARHGVVDCSTLDLSTKQSNR